MKFLMLFVVLLIASCGKEEAKVTGPVIERAKDPVCGMWVEKKKDCYPLLHDGALYYFCCNECALAFANNTAKYAIPCDCKKIKRDCKCDHCQGKQVPCDCKWN